ncbi:hypothetical protein P3T37_000650 [Kitasatospora sp. MAA4]|nr:hypothetical protein [Kitasatospora sp. MAA4]MDH6131281.1 hypothetical protein [Kitasatospora sp. MAA4]
MSTENDFQITGATDSYREQGADVVIFEEELDDVSGASLPIPRILN